MENPQDIKLLLIRSTNFIVLTIMFVSHEVFSARLFCAPTPAAPAGTTAPSGPLVRHCSDDCMNVETIFRSTYRVVSNRTIVPCRTTSGHCLPLLCQHRVSFARRKSRLENKQSGLSVTGANWDVSSAMRSNCWSCSAESSRRLVF